MNSCILVFADLINQCNATMGLYDYLVSNKIYLGASDLLRWQFVLAVSALDKYIHDIVRLGMIDEFLGKRAKTSKFNMFKITLSASLMIKSSEYPEFEIEQEIIKQHGFLAFQDPDKIADALSFIWDEPHKWQAIRRLMKTPITETDLKIKLKNIVLRRNQIVHQGDCSFAPDPIQQDILKEDVVSVIEFIKEIVNAIDTCVNNSSAELCLV